ncbi:MAG: DUF4837 family protein [Bacteroidales bacterium]
MKNFKRLAIPFFIFLLSLAYACKDGARGKTLLPGVTGKSGEIIVVIDKALQESAVGEQLKEVLLTEYPMLPQSEPMFSPSFIPYTAFSNLFEVHRNIILVKISEEYKKCQILRQQDVWASPQTVINIVGNSVDSLTHYIAQHKNKLIHSFETAELQRNLSNIKRYEETELRALVKESFSINLYFPKGYKVRGKAKDFLWISYETEKTSQGIFIYQYPFSHQSLPNPKTIIKYRNAFLKQYVPGTLKGSYMTTVADINPSASLHKISTQAMLQLRSLWEVEGDFMGGPFVSYTLLDTAQQQCLVLEAYVYAPNAEKRTLMRQTDAVLKTLELPTP